MVVFGPDTTFTFSLGSKSATRCISSARSISCFCGGGNFVRRVYAWRKRPSESARDAIECNPLRASSCQSGGGGSQAVRPGQHRNGGRAQVLVRFCPVICPLVGRAKFRRRD